jgi:hypothetical protein
LKAGAHTVSFETLKRIAQHHLTGTDYAPLLDLIESANWLERKTRMKVAAELQKDRVLDSLAFDPGANLESLREQALLAYLLVELQRNIGQFIFSRS